MGVTFSEGVTQINSSDARKAAQSHDKAHGVLCSEKILKPDWLGSILSIGIY